MLCEECGYKLSKILFKEYKYTSGGTKTNKYRIAVDYLLCERCGERYICDDSLDEY